MEKIVVNGKEYEIVNNDRDAFDKDAVETAMTDYYDEFDLVVGDWAYGKLRLKGFNETDNKNFKPINDSSKISDYISKHCAYGCKWFTIRKVK